MRARAEQATETRRRILDAAYDLFMAKPFDEVTLEAVADRAGVAVQTVLRHVGSKEGLVVAGRDHWVAQEHARRAVAPGDVDGAARILGERYEMLGDRTSRARELEARIPSVAESMARARRRHVSWLGEVFGPWLGGQPAAVRRIRLAQLFGATEIYVWTSWRSALGLSARQCERALASSLHALIEAWEREDEGGA